MDGPNGRASPGLVHGRLSTVMLEVDGCHVDVHYAVVPVC